MKFNLNSICDKRRWVLLAAILFTLLIRLLTVQPLDDAGDSKMYMDHVRQLLIDPSEYHFDHWASRFGIIVPVWLIRIITAGSAAGAYVLPLVLSLVISVLLILVAERLYRIEAGFLAALVLAVYPEMVREGSQILPGIFSMVYLLSSLYFMSSYIKGGRLHNVLLSALFMFFAYETHLINLFFAPGIAFYLILTQLRQKRTLQALFLFGGTLLILFIIETLFYSNFTEYSLGQLDIARSSHLEGNSSLVPLKPWQLFYRFLRPGPLFVILLGLSIGFSVDSFKRRDYLPLVPFFAACSYFLFLLIAVKSINPLVPALPMNVRYLDASIPFMLLFLSFAAVSIFERRGHIALLRKFLFAAAPALVIVFMIANFHNIVRNNIMLTVLNDTAIDSAVQQRLPMVYVSSDAYSVSVAEDSALLAAHTDAEQFFFTEESGRIKKNVKYLNAFYINTIPRFNRVLLHAKNGVPVLACLSHASLSKDQFAGYLNTENNELLLISRRPLAVRKISVGEYFAMYDSYEKSVLK